jgi:hypothetical protein
VLGVRDDDRATMMIQLQAFAACDDEEVRDATSAGQGRIVGFVQAASGASPNELDPPPRLPDHLTTSPLDPRQPLVVLA